MGTGVTPSATLPKIFFLKKREAGSPKPETAKILSDFWHLASDFLQK